MDAVCVLAAIAFDDQLGVEADKSAM